MEKHLAKDALTDRQIAPETASPCGQCELHCYGRWVSIDDKLPEIPRTKFSVSVIGCWDCCNEEKNIVSEVSFDREGNFCQLAYGPMGCKWMKVDVKKWTPLPKA